MKGATESTLPMTASLLQFLASDLSTAEQVVSLFSNFSWSRNLSSVTVQEYDTIRHWQVLQ